MSEQPDRRLGQILSQYRLLRVIGRGGMGVVYEAEHVRLGRIAAVKVIHPDVASNPNVTRRFLAEAMTVARLQHPNIVDIYDVGEMPEPHAIMELLRGRSLGDELGRSALPEARSIAIVTQALTALAVVHQRKIVHRDIKPDNIFLVADGVHTDFVKLLDFGIAKIIEGRPGGTSALTGGALIGTPMYMAPEQIEGKPVDGRTDLYALGLVLYHMLTGRAPYEAATLTALLTQQLLELPAPIRALVPTISPSVEGVVSRCIAKEPAERFADATAVLVELGAVTAVAGPLPPTKSVVAPTVLSAAPKTATGFMSTLGRSSGQLVAAFRHGGRRTLVWLSGAIVALAAAAATLWVTRSLRSEVSQPKAEVSQARAAAQPMPAPAPVPVAAQPPAGVPSTTPPPAPQPSAAVSPAVPPPPPEPPAAAAPVDDEVRRADEAVAACLRGDSAAYRAAVAQLAPAKAAEVAAKCPPLKRPPARRAAPPEPPPAGPNPLDR
jgi:serine/threonine-protein kinase